MQFLEPKLPPTCWQVLVRLLRLIILLLMIVFFGLLLWGLVVGL
jgi:hypothetical protein